MENVYKHIGAYGLVVNDNKILLVKKKTGPYDGLLDLPGGTIEFNETPLEALKREFKEEVGINVIEAHLFDADSVNVDWNYENELIKVHHIGIFYKIDKYEGEIKKENTIDEINDDSMGAEFYDINSLKETELSKIAIMEINRLK